MSATLGVVNDIVRDSIARFEAEQARKRAEAEESDVITGVVDMDLPEPASATVQPAAKPATSADESIIDLDSPKPTTQYEGFLTVALRAHARGQRVLPIKVGAKKPLTEWLGSLIDTDTTAQWAEHSVQWVHEFAVKFPDAAACVVAKPFEFAFIDEDSSAEFRKGYEDSTGEPFPRTFTTESRPNHRQSHWRQTDATRALSNVSQVKQGDRDLFSFRQHNLYVLSEGSPHPSGTFYRIVDSTPAAPMPDKLVAYMRHLKETSIPADKRKVVVGANGVEIKEEIDASLNGPKIPYGQHDTMLFKIACKIRHNEPDITVDELYERLVAICEARCERYGSDYRDMCRNKAHSAMKYEDKDNLSDAMRERIAQKVQQQREQAENVQQQPAQTDTKPPQPAVPVDVSNWRSKFRNISEMEQGDPVMLIDGVLQEGTCFLGAAPSHGKTLVALAMAKALTLGTPLFGLPQYAVKQTYPVLYLIPETSDRPFRRRCEAFRLPTDDRFLVRTITAGANLKLTDADLLEAVGQRHFVVVLDTTRRFNPSSDSNSDAQNQQLVTNVNDLRAAGSPCVILLHHSTKAATQNRETMTLENMLSGTGDFGAMCDQAYGIRRDDGLYNRGAGAMEIELVNLKDRERLMGLTELRLAATYLKSGEPRPSSWIDETGNFRVVGAGETLQQNTNRLVELVKAHPSMTLSDLMAETGLKKYAVQQILKAGGWHSVQGGPNGASPWHQDTNGECPYKRHKSGIQP